MWPKTFDQRLESWYQLRNSANSKPVDQALAQINSWWFHAPWRPYYLDWDNTNAWPDPWQLLKDNFYCDLARGLGILYTISLLDRTDMAPADLILTDDGYNLVQVAKEKYILNCNANSVVNTFQAVQIKQQYQQHHIV